MGIEPTDRALSHRPPVLKTVAPTRETHTSKFTSRANRCGHKLPLVRARQLYTVHLWCQFLSTLLSTFVQSLSNALNDWVWQEFAQLFVVGQVSNLLDQGTGDV